MTQYVVQTNMYNNAAEFTRIPAEISTGVTDDDEGTTAMDFEDTSASSAPALTEILQSSSGESEMMIPFGQGQGQMFYAYGEGEDSAQLYVISEVLDENTGQMMQVAIPIDASSLVDTNAENIPTAIDSNNEDAGVSVHDGDGLATVNTDTADNSLGLSGITCGNDELLSLSSHLEQDGSLQPLQINSTTNSGIEIELGDESDATEITVKEEGADDEGDDEQTTTTEFRIVQTGNRVIVRNSEGAVVNEFPLPESPNHTEANSADAFMQHASKFGEILTGIDSNLIATLEAPSHSIEPTPKKTHQMVTPVNRRKKVYPGTKRKARTNSAQQLPKTWLPPGGSPSTTCDNKIDPALADKIDLPFCYSGEAFNIQSQKLILNVYDFFKKVNQGVISSICVGSPIERAARVLNVSQSVVSRLKRRYSDGRIDLSQDSSPSRKEGFKRVVDLITSNDEDVIRNIIDDFAKKGIIPTIPMLLQAAREKMGFAGSRSSFRRVLHRIGYKSSKPIKTVVLSITKANRNAPSSVCSKSPRSSTSMPASANNSGMSGSSFSDISPDTGVASTSSIGLRMTSSNDSSLTSSIQREAPIIKFYYGPLPAEPSKKSKGAGRAGETGTATPTPTTTLQLQPFDAHLSNSF